MRKSEVKIKEKVTAEGSRKGRGYASRHTVRRRSFVGTSEALNTLHVKFNCGEGKEGGRFSEFLRLTTAYLSMNLDGGRDIETSIRNGKCFDK